MKIKLEMMDCNKCGDKMPVLRFSKYGYKSCINCSSVQKLGGVPITNHKTGNEIQIMPMEDAQRLYKLSQRQGYGVCKGMKHN